MNSISSSEAAAAISQHEAVGDVLKRLGSKAASDAIKREVRGFTRHAEDASRVFEEIREKQNRHLSLACAVRDSLTPAEGHEFFDMKSLNLARILIDLMEDAEADIDLSRRLETMTQMEATGGGDDGGANGRAMATELTGELIAIIDLLGLAAERAYGPDGVLSTLLSTAVAKASAAKKLAEALEGA